MKTFSALFLLLFSVASANATDATTNGDEAAPSSGIKIGEGGISIPGIEIREDGSLSAPGIEIRKDGSMTVPGVEIGADGSISVPGAKKKENEKEDEQDQVKEPESQQTI